MRIRIRTLSSMTSNSSENFLNETDARTSILEGSYLSEMEKNVSTENWISDDNIFYSSSFDEIVLCSEDKSNVRGIETDSDSSCSNFYSEDDDSSNEDSRSPDSISNPPSRRCIKFDEVRSQFRVAFRCQTIASESTEKGFERESEPSTVSPALKSSVADECEQNHNTSSVFEHQSLECSMERKQSPISSRQKSSRIKSTSLESRPLFIAWKVVKRHLQVDETENDN